MSYRSHVTGRLRDRNFIRSATIALPLFVLSLALNYVASTYATRSESAPVTDIVLSNTAVRDVDGIFVLGTLLLVASISYLVLVRLNRLPFVLESLALFVAIRSVFITLTHIAPFPNRVLFDSSLYARVNFGGDLFFSGHTGMPFLLALLFWDRKALRYFFLSLSAFFAIVVLLGHLHYSIDVVSAYFITYSISHLARALFGREYQLFKEDV